MKRQATLFLAGPAEHPAFWPTAQPNGLGRPENHGLTAWTRLGKARFCRPRALTRRFQVPGLFRSIRQPLLIRFVYLSNNFIQIYLLSDSLIKPMPPTPQRQRRAIPISVGRVTPCAPTAGRGLPALPRQVLSQAERIRERRPESQSNREDRMTGWIVTFSSCHPVLPVSFSRAARRRWRCGAGSRGP